MSEEYWWSRYSSFKPWDQCPSRPDPVEVLHFYLEKREITAEQHARYLMELLSLQKTMAYDIFKGEGLDSISRCRQLVQALKIHPPLLGIDAKYYPVENHACWWQACGYSFHADAQGYPFVSEVIVGLRLQRTKTEGGIVKAWSQSDLGEATGLTKETVYNMEHDRNPQILDSMSRRATLALALSTLATENESTLFRLFGLDPQAYGASVSADEPLYEGHFAPKKLTDEMLKGYHRQQSALFTDYHTFHGGDSVGVTLEWVMQLEAVMPLANTTAQRVNVLALQSRYHQFLVNVSREKYKKDSIIFHANNAVRFAEQATTLPDLRNHALQNMSNELLAAALLRTAMAYYELGEYDLAQEYIDRAMDLLPTLQSRQIKSEILADAALIHAHTATSATDRQKVLWYLNLAARINDASQSSSESNIPDENFMRYDKGVLYIRKARILSLPQMKGATAETARDILEVAQKYTNPELIRRQSIIDLLQAQAYFNASEYEQTTQMALIALEKSQLVRSQLNKKRIEGLYHQLLQTSFRDKPLLAHLGVKLRTWR